MALAQDLPPVLRGRFGTQSFPHKAPASMLLTLSSLAQSMSPMSLSAASTGARFEEPRSISYHSSLGSLSRLRPTSPVKSVKPYHLRKVRKSLKFLTIANESFIASSGYTPSYASSPRIQQPVPRVHTLLYTYPLKPSAASPNLYPTPTINLKTPSNTNSHRNSLDINHNPAMSSESLFVPHS